MKYTSTTAHEELAGKRKALENARTQLRKEFIGIDKPIDDIIGSFGYWYYFPEIQTRPVIINLWGLTGVGKTSLINRLMELLGMQKKFFRFNLSDNEWDIRSTLADIYDNRQDNDFVILLDEFQHVRTIREDQTEKSTRHQFIWDLLDSGRIPVNNFQMRLGELSDLVHRLNRLLQLGVVVSNGNVVSGEEIYRRELGEINTYTGIRRRSGKQPNNDLCFVPKYFHEIIFETDREKFSLMSEVTELLNRMTGTETIAFLRKMVRHGLAARHLDCSRSLVFIIGNLDEAYAMAGNFDTEIDADEFHAESLKITLPVVKEALRRRFRSEQISRLGNNHIIYPALDSNAYKKIIENELDSLSRQFYNATGVWLLFDSSIHRLIYAEGVFPTQGTRPLLSTINNIVTSQFPRILFKIINSAPETESVVMYRRREKLLFKFMKDDRIIAGISEKAPLALENLRECTNDDMQAVTAVHESGHAIASLALLKTVPEIVCSVSANPENKGFVFTRNIPDFIARKEISARIAVLLGGYAAEKLVFGEENLTTGASSDISQATHMICSLLKSCGMGSLPASFNNQDSLTRFFIYDTDNAINEQAKKALSEALELAERTLSEHFSLLVTMGSYLSSNRSMRKDDIIKMVEAAYGQSGIAQGLRERPPAFYRDRLMELVSKEVKCTPVERPEKGGYGYSLNRD